MKAHTHTHTHTNTIVGIALAFMHGLILDYILIIVLCTSISEHSYSCSGLIVGASHQKDQAEIHKGMVIFSQVTTSP